MILRHVIPTIAILCWPFLASAEDTRPARHVFSAEALEIDVRNRAGEELGHIEDFVINRETGDIVYAAMARGQILGFGGNYFAISPEALTLSANHEFFILDASNQDFENAKGFDQNSWPSQANPRWGKAAANGNEGSVKSNKNLMRVNAITGMTVYGSNNKSVGEVYNAALNWKEHKVAYIAVHHGGTLGIGGKLVAVPLQALGITTPGLDPQRRAFYIRATAEDFQNADGFNADNWPAEPSAVFKNLRRSGE